MKTKKSTAILCVLTAVVMLLSFTVSSVAFNGSVTYSSSSGKYTATKISHPDKGLREVDGIVDYVGNGITQATDKGQGARGQNYSWSAIGVGDYVYVATCYNAMGQTLDFMDSVLGNDFEKDQMKAALDVMFHGDFFTGEVDGYNAGGVLVKVNVHTNEVTQLMGKSIDGINVLLRNCCEYQGKLYFCGSVGGLAKIVQVDPETDECKVVYSGISAQDAYLAHKANISSTIRGLCVYEDKLILSAVTLEGPQILISDHPWDGQEAFTEIADQEALFNYPAYHYTDSIYGGSIWEMVEFNGSVYVSLCTGTPENKPDEYSMQSFALVRGDENEDGTWTWTAVAGNKEKDGAKYTFGIDPERTRAGACVLQVYGDYLYLGEYNDEQLALEGILFKSDFEFMNRNLEQSVSLYRMDKNENIELVVGDATKMFPEGSLSGIGSGFGRHENQYMWRMTSYNGKLYVGTFDTSSLLEPVAQLTNGDVITMSVPDWLRLLGFVKTLLDITSETDSDIQAVKALFENFSLEALANIFKSFDITAVTEKFGDSEETLNAIMKVWEIVEGILECSRYTVTAERGFDLYVSEDGVNFNTITTNGFGDPYNHGLRVFANMDSGLMIGTANPFYSTQIWMLEEDASLTENASPVTNPFKLILEKLIRFFKDFIEMIMENFTAILPVK